MPQVRYVSISYYNRGIVHIIFKDDASETLCGRKYEKSYGISSTVGRRRHLCKACKRRMRRIYPEWRYYGP